MTGTIKNIVADRNFGFIKTIEGEYFFHRDDFIGDWDKLCEELFTMKQLPVEFDVASSTKGPRASNVHRVK